MTRPLLSRVVCPGQIPSHGGASNPYLVGAAAIAAGLDGIRNQIEPPPPTEGLAYGLEDGPTPIPIRLEAALDELEKDTVLRGLMGEELIHLFLAVKRHEIAKATEHARDYPGRRLGQQGGRLRGRGVLRVPVERRERLLVAGSGGACSPRTSLGLC